MKFSWYNVQSLQLKFNTELREFRREEILLKKIASHECFSLSFDCRPIGLPKYLLVKYN